VSGAELVNGLSRLITPLLSPLGLAVVLGLVVLARMPRRTWQRRVLGASLALLFVAGNHYASMVLARSLERRYLPIAAGVHADAIVTLGGAAAPAVPPRQGIELIETSDRLLHAARLFRRGVAPLVQVAAGLPGLSGPDDPTAESDMTTLLREFGVPREAMLEERRSRNTYENALESRRLLEPRGIRRIVLVTSAVHMQRAVATYCAQGFVVIPAPTDYAVVNLPFEPFADGVATFLEAALVPDAESLAQTTRALREWIGLAVYRLAGRTGICAVAG